MIYMWWTTRNSLSCILTVGWYFLYYYCSSVHAFRSLIKSNGHQLGLATTTKKRTQPPMNNRRGHHSFHITQWCWGTRTIYTWEEVASIEHINISTSGLRLEQQMAVKQLRPNWTGGSRVLYSRVIPCVSSVVNRKFVFVYFRLIWFSLH